MALIGSYSVTGTSSSVTLSNQYTTIDELLIAIPDNTAGAIQAGDIRDSVYSLWKQIESASASATATVSVSYDRTQPSTNLSSVGGVSNGSTFSGTIQDVLDRIFYPYNGPGANLTSWVEKEYGDPTGYSFALSYTAVVYSNPLTSIVVNGTSKPLTPLTGTEPATSTHSSINPSSTPGVQQSYSMSVSDGTTTTNTNATINWLNKIYWGRIDLTSLGNPNLTTNPGSASSVEIFINSATLLGLNGAGANGLAYGSELSSTKSKTYNNINGFNGLYGNHLIFAWPSNISGAYTPTFMVNGLMSTAFTRVKNNWKFTNSFGFNGSDYEVWVSNTVQNSPLNIIIT